MWHSYIHQIHLHNLNANLVVVVGFNARSPVGRDTFTAIPDVFAIDLVGAEERHHGLVIK